MEISKELQKINKDDLLVSYDFNSLYPSAQIDIKSTWPQIETVYPFKKYMSNTVCSLFNSGWWNELNRSTFFYCKMSQFWELSFSTSPNKRKLKTLKKGRD